MILYPQLCDLGLPLKKAKKHYEIRRPAADRGTHKPQLRLHGKITEITPKHCSRQPTSSEDLGFYDMKSKRHGVALIISNKEFTDKDHHTTREGAEIDEQNLSETWQFLGYHVIILRDCTKHEMLSTFKGIEELLKKAAESEKVANDSFVCCILSHGGEGLVYGSDSQPVLHNEIQEQLGASDILFEKPKLLFIEACQGSRSLSLAIRPKVGVDGEEEFITHYTDFYLSCATVYGYEAIIHADNGELYCSDYSYFWSFIIFLLFSFSLSSPSQYMYMFVSAHPFGTPAPPPPPPPLTSFFVVVYIYTGSYFISGLCTTLCEFSTVMDLDELQKKVNASVVSVPIKFYDKKKDPKTGKFVRTGNISDRRQQPRGIDQLRKKVFFFQQ